MGTPEILGKYHLFEVEKGIVLRYFHSPPAQEPSKGTLVILTGRASCIERYENIIPFWHTQGYEVFVLDWRGQGASTRIRPDFEFVHIDHYSTYVSDLIQWLDSEVLPRAKRPIILYAVSMGALVAGLMLQEDQVQRIDRGILIVPLFGLPAKPFARRVAQVGSEIFCRLGLGHLPFPGAQRQAREQFVAPDLFSHGLSFGWLNATFKALRLFHQPERLKHIQIPIFMARAGLDQDVDNSRDPQVAETIPNCKLKTYPNAPHGIHHSSSELRNELLQDCLNFLQDPLR